MFVLARGQVSGSSEVTWVSEYPTAPLTDYYAFNTLPDVENIGTVSLFTLDATHIDAVWDAGRAYSVTTVSPSVGPSLLSGHWHREVDSITTITLTLNNENLSTSWVRVSDTAVAPRRQI